MSKKPMFVLVAVSVLLLTACTATTSSSPENATDDPVSAETTDAGSGDIAGSCEAFNSLAEKLRSADESEENVFLDIYQEAGHAAAEAPSDLKGALISLQLIALDRNGGDVPKEHSDLVLEQLTAITPICADEGVEIVL